MIGMNLTVTKTESLKSLEARLKDFSNLGVYVGIPESKAPRKKDRVNNAQLLFIFSNGSPVRNQPPRPVIQPAIEASPTKDQIAEYLKQALKAMLEGKKRETLRFLGMAGFKGAMASKAWFFNPANGWKRNAPSTVREKLKKINKELNSAKYKSKKGKAAANARLALVMQQYLGGAANMNTVGIDTAQMINAITYVIDDHSHLSEAEMKEELSAGRMALIEGK